MVDNSNENPFSFDVQSLPSERSEDDVLLSDSNENNTEIPATWVFEADGETWKSNSRVPEIEMAFSSEEAAYEFYKSYANEIGFNVRKGKAQRSTNKTIRKRHQLKTIFTDENELMVDAVKAVLPPSRQMDSGIPAKDGGGGGIGDSEVDTAKTSDYEENRLIRRKLGLSKKQSHSYTSRVLQNTQSLHPQPSKQKLTESQKDLENKTTNQENLKTLKNQMDLYGYVQYYN
ncbi:hypothetical protein OIU84_026360 [Salix udensis]|uniref:Protein FAR1-RELATED SEQUENCE n=1 Tax=Salix udensis TaxID=889485 RepID=A0AAD6KLP4_9ROSI|nr:hypothetical protein OIU84_026360 [Salix udensis]